MLVLSQTDREIVATMREFGVLADIDGHRVDQRNGVIMLPCSDGDQFPDVFRHQLRLTLAHRVSPRIHPISMNGGALVIPRDSPLKGALPIGEVMLDQIWQAMQLKGITTVVLYAHAPCGMAATYDMNFAEVVATLFQAKMAVREEHPDAKIICFAHVDAGDKKRTYFVSRERWAGWCAKRRAGLLESTPAT